MEWNGINVRNGEEKGSKMSEKYSAMTGSLILLPNPLSESKKLHRLLSWVYL